jgi:hypothetical protein
MTTVSLGLDLGSQECWEYRVTEAKQLNPLIMTSVQITLKN